MKLLSLFSKKLLLGSAVSLASFLCASHLPAAAQVGVSPLVIEERAVQGRSQGVITLTNSKSEPIRVRVFAEPFTYGVDGFTELAESPADLSNYLQFSPREVVIPAGEEQRIRLLTLFPPDLAPGEYRAIIFAEELTETPNFIDNVAVNIRIGTTVYVHNGELSGELSTVSAQSVAEESQIQMRLQNEGLSTVRVTTDWQLYAAEREVASGTVPVHTVIAEGERQIPIALPEALPAGTYTLKGNFSWRTLGEENTRDFEVPVVL